ncbi:MAG: DNA-directed RNA polymerase subunit RpoH/Rpb5 C-terminal domain-containing protein [Candidatus Heimdallarchaeaceae archaeon]
MSSKEQKAKEKRITDGVKEILEFRGFQIKNTKEDDDFLDIYAEKISEKKEKITAIARFPKNPQIGVKLIRLLGKLQEEEKLGEALLIAESPLTHYAKKESVKLGIEIISSNNPLFNIFDHAMVRQHVKLKSPEIKYFLERYQIEKHQIPKILESDAAVKAIQAKPGDIIKIVRNPDMGENGSYYRVVIKSTSRLRLVETGTIKKKTTRKTPPKKPKETPEKPVEDKQNQKQHQVRQPQNQKQHQVRQPQNQKQHQVRQPQNQRKHQVKKLQNLKQKPQKNQLNNFFKFQNHEGSK